LKKDQENNALPTHSVETILNFFRFVRENGLGVGLEEAKKGLSAANLGLIGNKISFKYALRSICCGHADDIKNFNYLFEAYWGDISETRHGKLTLKSEVRVDDSPPGTLILMGQTDKKDNDPEKEAKSMAGAHILERLRVTDLTKIQDIESDFFEELAHRLWKQMSYRLKRRMKAGSQGRTIDFNKTIRKSISRGGWTNEIAFKQKKIEKKRLVMLLDVSGSMDKYSFFLLKFIYILKKYFEKIEAFTFSTRLVRVTRMLEGRNIDQSLKLISREVKSWSSGTKIGECLKDFNIIYSKQILSRSSIVIILSDGLDTGDPGLLSKSIENIKLRTKQLIWLNPLKGTDGYEPVQKGMASALPYVDQFQSARNLDSLLELENYLTNV